MERQIGPLHPVHHHRRRARIPLVAAAVALPIFEPRPRDGRRDVPDGRPLLLLLLLLLRSRGRVALAAFSVVRRQGVGAGEVEGAPGGARGRSGAEVDFLRGDGAVVADLAGGDAEGFLAEHVALFVLGV